jgi:CDP-diacylglycerol--glycerol-3-phosphate 3-phosphatidyltransferase
VLTIIGREFMISGLRMVAASKGVIVEADAGGKVKTFLQLNAIGWLLGTRMLTTDFGDLFNGVELWQVRLVHNVGLGFFVLSVVLTITSGYTYFRRHGHVVRD